MVIGELWRASRYPGYWVSSLGGIKGPSGEFMRGVRNTKSGYLQITITANRSGTGKQVKAYLHEMVCTAFHGNRPFGKQVAHDDGNKWNNAAWNLRWATPGENNNDRRRHGTINTNRRLTPEQAKEIRSRYSKKEGVTMKVLGEEFGLSLCSISQIIRGETYRDVE